MIISLNSFGIRKASMKSCRESQNTHIMFSAFFLIMQFKKYKKMWNNHIGLGATKEI